jgi:hypothetical protein
MRSWAFDNDIPRPENKAIAHSLMIQFKVHLTMVTVPGGHDQKGSTAVT